jgi:hypothetical protein
MSKVAVLDNLIHGLIGRVIKQAQRDGADIAERLNQVGLIWTPERELEIKARTLEYLLEEMQSWSPHEFLRIVNRSLSSCTPTDMYMAICKWTQVHIDHVRDEARRGQ